jgi:predicted MFS family arabinose efflux permease
VATDRSWGDFLSEGRAARFLLICLGVWLNAADSLVTSTIMPSVGRSLGGYAYFAWATALFFVGAILAGASAGRLSEIFGLRPATVTAALIMGAGCLLSAFAPSPFLFLAGRLIQGLGSGWISGFAMVAIAFLFPERHWARVFASVSFVWGIATVLGPLVGGVVVQTGNWRAVFHLFAGQTAIFALAAFWLLRGTGQSGGGPGIPWAQLGLLGLGVAAFSAASLIPNLAGALALTGGGFAVLALVAVLDDRLGVRLLPHRTFDLSTTCGSGYLAIFMLTAASMAFSIYGPPILQQLRHFTPLWAGYAIGVESAAWTLTAMIVAGADPPWDARWIRVGSVMLVASLLMLAVWFADGTLVLALAGGAVLGAAFGVSWGFFGSWILAALSDADRATGSSAITAVRQTGAAAGAALSGLAANLSGMSGGLTDAAARAAGFWIYVSVIPLGLIGVWAAFRLTSRG